MKGRKTRVAEILLSVRHSKQNSQLSSKLKVEINENPILLLCLRPFFIYLLLFLCIRAVKCPLPRPREWHGGVMDSDIWDAFFLGTLQPAKCFLIHHSCSVSGHHMARSVLLSPFYWRRVGSLVTFLTKVRELVKAEAAGTHPVSLQSQTFTHHCVFHGFTDTPPLNTLLASFPWWR